MKVGPRITCVDLNAPHIVAAPEPADRDGAGPARVQLVGGLDMHNSVFFFLDLATFAGELLGLVFGQNARVVGAVPRIGRVPLGEDADADAEADAEAMGNSGRISTPLAMVGIGIFDGKALPGYASSYCSMAS